MYSTLFDDEAGNDPSGSPAYLEMSIGEREIAGLEIKNQHIRYRPGPEVADLQFPAE